MPYLDLNQTPIDPSKLDVLCEFYNNQREVIRSEVLGFTHALTSNPQITGIHVERVAGETMVA